MTAFRPWRSMVKARRGVSSGDAMAEVERLVAPPGILGTVLGVWLTGMERDVYFQVAMLTTVGLTSKDAILAGSPRRRRAGRSAGGASRLPGGRS